MTARLLVINPNTSAAMTAALVAEVRRHVPAATAVAGVTGAFGLPVIASRAGFAIAGHAALDAYARAGAGADAVILGCFGDPGLAALREVALMPVVGLAEASFTAMTGPFAVLTAGPAWRAMLLEQVALLPQAGLCRGVWTLGADGAAVARDPAGFVAALDRLAGEAVAAGATSIILGGAVLAGYAPRLQPVARFVDCVRAAVDGLAMAPAAAGRNVQPGPPAGLSQALTALLAGTDGAG